MKSFVTSQFEYSPLIWMFHGRRVHDKIHSVHERALKITYQYHVTAFQELLKTTPFQYITEICKF